MSNLTLTSKDGGDFKPHPEGIHPAACVDVVDLGLVETEFQGQKSMVNKVKHVLVTTFPQEASGTPGAPDEGRLLVFGLGGAATGMKEPPWMRSMPARVRSAGPSSTSRSRSCARTRAMPSSARRARSQSVGRR